MRHVLLFSLLLLLLVSFGAVVAANKDGSDIRFFVDGETIFKNGVYFAKVYLFRDNEKIAGVAIHYAESNNNFWVLPRNGRGLCIAQKNIAHLSLDEIWASWLSQGPCYSEKLRLQLDKVSISPDGKKIFLLPTNSDRPLIFNVLKKKFE